MTTLTSPQETRHDGTDAADARRAGGGDVRAFERLYHRHAARIHTLARRMIGTAEADEAVQDVFVRAWEKLSTFRGDASFGTWLYRLAIHALLRRRERRGRRRARETEGATVLETRPARRSRPDLRVDLEAAIERLPDGAREVFVLYDVEGYKHREIARMLGVTTGTSKSQLHRARLILRDHLQS